MHSVVWDRGAWLFLKRWGAYPNGGIAKHSMADPQPVLPWKWRKRDRPTNANFKFN
jgi:hypothetical protein